MTDIKTGIKLVRMIHSKSDSHNKKRKPHKYFSVFDDGLVTKYKKFEWTERTSQHGPFAVFDTLRNAKFFMRRMGGDNDKDVYYFNCEYEESVQKDLFYIISLRDHGRMSKVRLPKGTQLADKVKITTLIK